MQDAWDGALPRLEVPKPRRTGEGESALAGREKDKGSSLRRGPERQHRDRIKAWKNTSRSRREAATNPIYPAEHG